MHTWEVIDPPAPTPAFPGVPVPPPAKAPSQITDRMLVPGGWLYRTRIYGEGSQGRHQPPSVAMVFVPFGGEGAFAYSHGGDALPALAPV